MCFCVCVCVHVRACAKRWRSHNLPARSFTRPDQELGEAAGGKGGGGLEREKPISLSVLKDSACFECHLTISF